MSKYKPKPLQIVRTGIGLAILEKRGTLGIPIAQIYSPFSDVTDTYANLFATAPAMLEALEWLVRIYLDDASIDELDDAIAFAQEAIASVKS